MKCYYLGKTILEFQTGASRVSDTFTTPDCAVLFNFIFEDYKAVGVSFIRKTRAAIHDLPGHGKRSKA